MNIETTLITAIQRAIEQLYGQAVDAKLVQLQQTKREFEGHLTLVVFPFLRISRKAPQITAQEIGDYLTVNESMVAA